MIAAWLIFFSGCGLGAGGLGDLPAMRRGCDHLRVLIQAIERAWNARTRGRLIRGHCQDCWRDVRRVDGVNPTEWKAAS
jgi:hypothetical protein